MIISPKEFSILGAIASKSEVDPDIIEREIEQIELGEDAVIVAKIIIQQIRKVPIIADQKYINLANAIRSWAEAMRKRNLTKHIG